MASQTQDQAPVPEVIAVEMAKDRELRRQERQALTAIPAADLAVSPMRTTFMPQSMGEAMQLATIMARSTFVPGHCRGSEGNCLAIIMQASRWGMDPFAVANKAYFTKDGAPPAFEAQLVNAVVNSSGALSGRLRIEFEGEGEKLRCTVRGFLRADPNDEKVRTQSIARITVRNSPLWKSDPEQQLGYYTTRAWARMHCPEVLLGVYTPDELEIEPERARVVSPPLPRRGDQIDPATGEVYGRDSRGFTEVDEETARALDAGNDGTLSDENPTAEEGKGAEQSGEDHNGSEPAGDAIDELERNQRPARAAKPKDEPKESPADRLIRLIPLARSIGEVDDLQDEFSEAKGDIDNADVSKIRNLIATRRNDLAD